MRLLLESKVKFVGRAVMVWGREKELSAFLENDEALCRGVAQG